MKKLIIYFIALIFSLNSFSQDSIKSKMDLLDVKMQLIDTKLLLLESKLQLLDQNPVQIDAKLQELDKTLTELKHLTQKTKSNIDTIQIEPFISAITINPYRIMEGSFHVAYERAIKSNLSLELGLLGTYSSENGIGRMYMAKQDLAYEDITTNQTYSINDKMMMGFGVSLTAKNYLLTAVNSKTEAPIGLYAAPQILFRHNKITGTYTDWDTQEEFETNQTLNILRIGALLGGKFTIAKVLCVDIYVGGALRLSKYYADTSFTKYKYYTNIDYSGVLPTAGIKIGVLK